MWGAARGLSSAAGSALRQTGATSSLRGIGRNIMRGNINKLPKNFGMLGRSSKRLFGRAGTAIGQRLDPRLASVRAMGQKAMTSSQSLMDKAQKRF